MARHRPRSRPRWLWPLSWCLALAVVAVLVLLPAAWWEAIWPRGELPARPPGRRSRPALEVVDVVVLRPPAPVATVPDDVEDLPPAPAPEPDWWERAWSARIAADLEPPPRAAFPDTLVPAPLRDLWGARAAVDLIVTAPDSVLRARLRQLVQEERLGARDLGGIYSAIARARAYVDMQRRAAAMFDEFGADQVRVPD